MFVLFKYVLHNAIMENIKDYKGNVLAITDAEVATDWRMGFLRAIAKVALNSYPAIRINEPAASRFGGNIEGGMNEHIEGARRPILDEDNITTGYTRDDPCPIVEIYNLVEDSSTHYEFNSFGDDGGSPVTLITAEVSCACGKIVRKDASLEIRAGNFISAVTNADSL